MEETFTEYVNARGAMLLRFAFVLCGNRHLAEDLVQEVLARAHRKWPRVTAASSPDAYLRKAVVREFLSFRRRLSSRELTVADLPEPAGRVGATGPHADAQTAVTDRDEMWRLLAGLPRMQRTVLVLRFYQDLPNEQIAELLGCAVGTVRVHASRGLARLRVTLDPEPAGSTPLTTTPSGGKA